MKKLLIVIAFISIAWGQVFKNVRVDKTAFQPNEVTIAINPLNTDVIAAGSNLRYFYYSEDGGKSWTEKEMKSLYGVYGDPVVLYDDSNNLYFSHLKGTGWGVPGFADRIVIQRSVDFGKNWTKESFTTPNSPKFQDKEWMAVDLTPSSPHKNNLYIAWTEFDKYGVDFNDKKSRILFSFSKDKGVSWSTAQKISDLEGNCVDGDLTTEGAVPATGPNGEIYISWAYNSKIYFDKSLDGGKTFGTDIIAAGQPGGWNMDIPGISRCNGMPVTRCDVSNSKYKGRIYINWADQRNGSDNVDIFITWSDDKGKTWSLPKKVNDDNSKRHQFFTWMAVDRTDGNIYIVFYDRRNTQGNATDVYLAYSNNGGATFKNVKISENSFIPVAQVFFGDYLNIDAHNGKIHPVWTRQDNRKMSVWTTAIKKKDLWKLSSLEEKRNVISSYKLKQNYPNPFNPETIIEYEIPEQSFVTLKVYNMAGKEIVTLVNQNKEAGKHSVNFNGKGLASGIYLCKIFAGEFQSVKKMILVK